VPMRIHGMIPLVRLMGLSSVPRDTPVRYALGTPGRAYPARTLPDEPVHRPELTRGVGSASLSSSCVKCAKKLVEINSLLSHTCACVIGNPHHAFKDS
jgi:hypothetical protein